MRLTYRKQLALFFGCNLVLALAAFAQANPPKEERHTVTFLLDRSVTNFEGEFIPLAEAMPEDKFSFAPSEGEFKNARTFAQQIKHVAAVNYELAGAILQEKPPADINDEAGPVNVATKEQVLKYLKDSFAYVHKAVATIDDKNLNGTVRSPFGEARVSRMGLAISVVGHGFDHYGQMCVYARMNGIVPPASR